LLLPLAWKKNTQVNFQDNTACITKLFSLDIITVSIITGNSKSKYKTKTPL